MAKVSDFLLNSDYPIDKIVFLKEVSIPYSASTTFSTTIPHKLGAVPFCNAVFSTDNWQTTYPSVVREMDDSGQYYTKMLSVSSDSTNVYVKGMFYGASGTIKARIWGVFDESSTFNVDAPATNGKNRFILNSDYNYPSLLKDGISDASSGSVTISHKLGYIPFCDLWAWYKDWDDSGYRWYPVSYVFYLGWLHHTQSGAPAPPQITSDSLTLRNGKFYYRIYGDDTTI
jgi:hypothetical protein